MDEAQAYAVGAERRRPAGLCEEIMGGLCDLDSCSPRSNPVSTLEVIVRLALACLGVPDVYSGEARRRLQHHIGPRRYRWPPTPSLQTAGGLLWRYSSRAPATAP